MARRTVACGAMDASVTPTEALASSYQNTLRYPSIAQPLNVKRATVFMNAGITNRGTMLPPSADIKRMIRVDTPESCARDLHSVAKTRPNDAAAQAVATV